MIIIHQNQNDFTETEEPGTQLTLDTFHIQVQERWSKILCAPTSATTT